METLAATPLMQEVLRSDLPLRQQLEQVAAYSPFVAEMLGRYPFLLTDLVRSGRLLRSSEPGEIASLVGVCAPAGAAEDAFTRELRLVRHRELIRIVWREAMGLSEVRESLRDLSDLADAAICAALDWSLESLRPRYGEARTESGEPCGFGILGMGKLGGGSSTFPPTWTWCSSTPNRGKRTVRKASATRSISGCSASAW